jgi:hypothetical protein
MTVRGRVAEMESQEGPVPAESESPRPRLHSRRSFLGILGLGLATVAGAGLLLKSSSLFRNGERAASQGDLPGEDSIFHPRQDVLERHRNG